MGTITRMLVLCVWAALCAGEPPVAARAPARRRDAVQAYAREFAREYEPYVFAAVPLHAPVPVLHVLSPAPLSVPPPARRPTPAADPPRPYTSSIRHTLFTRPYREPRPYSETNVYAESRPYVESRPYGETHPYAAPRPYHVPRPYADVRPYDSRPYVDSRPYANSRPYVAAIEYEDAAASDYAHRTRAAPARPSSAEYAADYDSYALYPPEHARLALSAPAQALLEADATPYSSQEAVLYARPSLSGGYTYRKITNKKTPSKKVPESKDQPVVVKIHKHKITKS